MIASKPMTKVLIIVSSSASVEELEATIREVKRDLGLESLKACKLVGGSSQTPSQKQQRNRSVLKANNVFILTPGMLNNLLSQGGWKIQDFSLMVKISPVPQMHEIWVSRSGTTVRTWSDSSSAMQL